MNSEILQAIWTTLLPSHVVVEVGGYSTTAKPGGASEQLATTGMEESRRVEFLSGRLYARKALIALGREPTEIPIAADRGPQWPEGLVGSITHTLGATGGWATAVVTDVATLSSLGVDLECCENLDPRALEMVLTVRERAHLMTTPPALRVREAGWIWCAKEAALKAARGTAELSEVEIVFLNSGDQFCASRRSEQFEDWIFEGRLAYHDGYALAAAYR
jgi:4'-phosphopantetheinyl transferase EntD